MPDDLSWDLGNPHSGYIWRIENLLYEELQLLTGDMLQSEME